MIVPIISTDFNFDSQLTNDNYNAGKFHHLKLPLFYERVSVGFYYIINLAFRQLKKRTKKHEGKGYDNNKIMRKNTDTRRAQT